MAFQEIPLIMKQTRQQDTAIFPNVYQTSMHEIRNFQATAKFLQFSKDITIHIRTV